MSGTKRQGVPPVHKTKAPENPLIPESTMAPPKSARDIYTDLGETPLPTERNLMSTINHFVNTIKANRTVLAKRALIAVGAAAGMALTSQLVDNIGKPKPAEPEVILLVDDFDVVDQTVDPENPIQ